MLFFARKGNGLEYKWYRYERSLNLTCEINDLVEQSEHHHLPDGQLLL